MKKVNFFFVLMYSFHSIEMYMYISAYVSIIIERDILHKLIIKKFEVNANQIKTKQNIHLTVKVLISNKMSTNFNVI